MVDIDESGFASVIQNYLINPMGFKLELIDAVLCKPAVRSSADEALGEYHGEQSSISHNFLESLEGPLHPLGDYLPRKDVQFHNSFRGWIFYIPAHDGCLMGMSIDEF